MKKELIYLWIYKDRNGCFNQMGFNFSPLFHVEFTPLSNRLIITNSSEYNLFKRSNLTNITALIGENGTGKTTLLQFLTSISDVPLRDIVDGYERYILEENSYNKFIAVYYDESIDANIKIINKIGVSIEYDGTTVYPYSTEGFQSENYIGKISHVYLSNSEYAKNNNSRSEVVDYLSLNNSSLNTVFFELFKRLFHIPNNFIFENTQFSVLQSKIFSQLNIQNSQVILDLMYQVYVKQSNRSFCGKKIHTISASIKSMLNLVQQDEVNAIDSQLRFSQIENTDSILTRIRSEYEKIMSYSGIQNVLLMNLLGELVYIYNFQLDGSNLSINDVYRQCSNYINVIQRETERTYYLHALSEIQDLSLLYEGNITDNSIPHSDLAYQEYVKIDVENIWRIIKESINEGYSFLLKYLIVENFEISSGERALLNFMSRIYFCSNMNIMIPNSGFELNKNVLLLIDEIDLYLHPEWQRRIINDLLNELTINFPEHYFQIILTSHSPIVLSDIPSENTIYLQRIDGEIEQVNRAIQTFGANIHSLYRDSFFIKNGLAMGEFAQSFINQLINDITHKHINNEEARRKINLIGEPIIKKKLNLMLNHNVPLLMPMEENELQNMISFLRRQKNDIERQLALLENR